VYRFAVALSQPALEADRGARYVRLADIAKVQAARIDGRTTPGRGAVKAIDEYNYCRFTKGWM